MGLAIPYAAATGKIDIAKEPKEHREFYGTSIMVTKDSAAAFKSGGSKLNFGDLWGKDTGQIQYRG
jgi:ribose transport system substrate-binding protein